MSLTHSLCPVTDPPRGAPRLPLVPAPLLRHAQDPPRHHRQRDGRRRRPPLQLPLHRLLGPGPRRHPGRGRVPLRLRLSRRGLVHVRRLHLPGRDGRVRRRARSRGRPGRPRRRGPRDPAVGRQRAKEAGLGQAEGQQPRLSRGSRRRRPSGSEEEAVRVPLPGRKGRSPARVRAELARPHLRVPRGLSLQQGRVSQSRRREREAGSPADLSHRQSGLGYV